MINIMVQEYKKITLESVDDSLPIAWSVFSLELSMKIVYYWVLVT